MIVVADTTPISYLVLIDEIALLPALFDRVLIPQAVFQELQYPQNSVKLLEWIDGHPDWLEVCQVSGPEVPKLVSLDPGESQAIQLALERGIQTILIDETAGRKIVEELHLEPRGTLGILERGANAGLTDFRSALSKLEQTQFRMAPKLKAAFLARNP